ncbi:chromobox protein homolog 3-like [Acyrthosiphon pisum]|uniref:Chromo shadow domain-containing protein n=1 Tax=Acyrthosiphon pisum TaxID=7029 RepID=A0A8R2H4M9_ACYPI|nr:chromobox protein homolog 3-like [Acyrthosiphon pisum]|eukprot:XP_016658299.1 PREDICTED: chromobox protein homolog 3-like [Acyrthosiphon pisum]
MPERIRIGIIAGVFLSRPPPDSEYPMHDNSVDLDPEMITHTTFIDGTRHHLVKWKDVEQLSYVSDSYANQKFPQLVIAYYENHIGWIKLA